MNEDVSPANRSLIKFINSTAIVLNPHVKKYDMVSILVHIVEDLKKREQGIGVLKMAEKFVVIY